MMGPPEDSEDLSVEEAAQAVETVSQDDLAAKIKAALSESPGYEVASHQLRRRSPHLYWRTFLRAPGESARMLIFQVDWLGD